MGMWTKAFTWLTIGIAAALLLPVLAMDGMFMDGMLYSAVAHNLANGYGSFWFPRFSEMNVAGLETFHEHPPLIFGMQALWFQLFGSAFWVERAYSLLMAIITAGLIALIWRGWMHDRSEKQLAWLPLLLWIIMPTVHWCCHNNMMENTMAVFTTAAVLFSVKAREKMFWPGHLVAGLMVFLAVLAKGIPGLFPIAAPAFIAMAATGRLGRGIGGSLVMLLTVAAAFGLLMLDLDARSALTIHVEKRLLHRVAAVPTVDHRWESLEMLFNQLLGPLIILALVAFFFRNGTKDERPWKNALAMIFTGLAGVFPLMLTLVQKSFYMMPALPVIAIGLALWIAPAVQRMLMKASEKVIKLVRWSGIAITAGAMVAAIMLFGEPHRDADMLHDVDLIGARLPDRALIGVPEEMWNEWNLQTYFMRRHSISIAHSIGTKWFLTKKNDRPEMDARPVELDLRVYELWEIPD